MALVNKDIEPRFKKNAIPKLVNTGCKLMEHSRLNFAVTPAEGTTLAHLQTPEYWAHVAQKFQPHTRIEAIAEDNAWFAELLVISTGPGWAKVKLLRHVVLDEAEGGGQNEEDQFTVAYGGVNHKHRVIRKSDKVVMKSGFPTKAEAVTWMREFEMEQLTAAA